MHILMIADHSDPLAKLGSRDSGGQNVYVNYLSRHLANKGVFADVYTRWDKPRKKEIIQVNKYLRVIRVKAGPKKHISKENFIKVLDEFTKNIIKRIIKENITYDLIQSNYWYSGLSGLTISKKFNIPQVHTFHSIGEIKLKALSQFKVEEENTKSLQFRTKQETKIAKQVSGIIATSPVEKETIKKVFGIDGSHIKVITIGVDVNIFHKTRKQKNNTEKIILYVGRLEWRKGIGTLLYAFKEVLKNYPESLLYIIGGGKGKEGLLDKMERDRLKNIAGELAITKNVHFLGPKTQKQLRRFYNKAGVCVIPSYYEPFGIVSIEALACGTPVVASRTGGLEYSVEDSVTGYLARVRDFQDFSRKINSVLTKGKEYFSANCIKRFRENFSWDKIIEEYIQYFNGLVK